MTGRTGAPFSRDAGQLLSAQNWIAVESTARENHPFFSFNPHSTRRAFQTQRGHTTRGVSLQGFHRCVHGQGYRFVLRQRMQQTRNDGIAHHETGPTGMGHAVTQMTANDFDRIFQ
jgi:hypothetical protein